MGRGKGWVTAEYAMLPASTGERKQRDISKGRQDGRGVEIQRLIGRSLRVVVDFKALGERSVYVDCDVLEADGGTRCASITGGYVALRAGLRSGCSTRKLIETMPLTGSIAAVSVGMVDGRALCDLDYNEDSSAEVDANVVMTGDGGLVEVQATAERTPLSRASLDELLALAEGGIAAPAGGRRSGSRDPRHRATATRSREMGELLPGIELRPLPDGFEMPPEDGDNFEANALIKARAAHAAPRRAGDRRRLGDRGRGPRRRAGDLLGPLRRGRRRRRGQPGEAAARGRRRRRQAPRRLRLRAGADRAPTAASTSSKRAARGACWRERRGSGGFGYDPAFVPDDLPPGDERTMAEISAGREERDQPPRPGRAAARRRTSGGRRGDGRGE